MNYILLLCWILSSSEYYHFFWLLKFAGEQIIVNYSISHIKLYIGIYCQTHYDWAPSFLYGIKQCILTSLREIHTNISSFYIEIRIIILKWTNFYFFIRLVLNVTCLLRFWMKNWMQIVLNLLKELISILLVWLFGRSLGDVMLKVWCQPFCSHLCLHQCVVEYLNLLITTLSM